MMLSTPQATLLVAEREITTQVRSKSFVISTAITLLVVLAGIVAAAIFGGREGDATPVAVVGPEAAEIVEASPGLAGVAATGLAEAEGLVRSEEVGAAIVPDADSPLGVRVIALSDAPSEVVDALSFSPRVDLLEPSQSSFGLRYLVAFAFGIVFMMSALGSGSMIAQNTVQEKQSRVVEILLAAVPARALMAGKILGNSVLGIGQAVAIAAVAALGLALTGQTELLDLLSGPIVWFVVFFLFGFVLIASIFAAGAALVSRQEDLGTVMTPAMILVMTPFLGVAWFSDNATVMTVLSYVPFSAPVGMPVRLFFGEALWWEPLVSLAILVVCTAVVTALATRIYTRSLLRTGARVSLRDAMTSD